MLNVEFSEFRKNQVIHSNQKNYISRQKHFPATSYMENGMKTRLKTDH